MKKKNLAELLLILFLGALLLSGCGHSHQFGEWTVTKPATCTSDGEAQRKCTGCDEVETQLVSAKGHQFGEWTTVSAATCDKAGTRVRVCADCGYKEEEVVPATGHSFSPATLRTPKTCTVCGITEGEPLATLITQGEEVTAEKHSFVVEEVYFSTKLSEKRGNHTTTYGTDGNYCIIKLSFTNNSTETLENRNTDRFSNIKLYYGGKYEYTGDYRLLIADEIVPLATENLFIYFNIPEVMRSDTENELLASFKIDGTTYAIVIQEGSAAQDAEDESKEESAEINQDVSVGETRTDGKNFSFELSEVYYSTKISEKKGNHTSTFGHEGNYLILKINFTNLKTEPLENNSDRISQISLTYDEKYKYEGDFRLLISDEIVPLANGNVFLYFSVPADLESREGPLVATFQIDGIEFVVNCR